MIKTLFTAIGKIFVFLNPFSTGDSDKYCARREDDQLWTKGSSIKDSIKNLNND